VGCLITVGIKVTKKPEAKSWLHLYIFLAIVWGASFSFVEAALSVTSPAGTTFWRTLLGALALITYLVVTRALPKVGEITWSFIWRISFVGLLLSVVPALLFAFAQERVTTVVSSIINSATPIATLVVMLIAFRDELPTLRQTSGIFVGLIGALVALGIEPGSLGENDPLAVIAVLGAIFCYGIGIPFSHKYVLPLGVPTKTMATFQVGTATVLLAPIYFFQTESLFTAVPDAWVLTQFLILGIIGTGFAYIWNFDMIERAGSAIASSVSYPALLVSLAMGWLVLKEPFSWELPIGAVLVVIGSAITQWRPAASKALR
jgi:drug/metabolite transporter (DMT)-like permease